MATESRRTLTEDVGKPSLLRLLPRIYCIVVSSPNYYNHPYVELLVLPWVIQQWRMQLISETDLAAENIVTEELCEKQYRISFDPKMLFHFFCSLSPHDRLNLKNRIVDKEV